MHALAAFQEVFHVWVNGLRLREIDDHGRASYTNLSLPINISVDLRRAYPIEEITKNVQKFVTNWGQTLLRLRKSKACAFLDTRIVERYQMIQQSSGKTDSIAVRWLTE
jgi:hypothetical protein